MLGSTAHNQPTVDFEGGLASTVKRKWRSGDRVFRLLTGAAAASVVVLVVATGIFILKQGWPSIAHYGFGTFIGSSRWAPSEASFAKSHPNPYGILGFIYGTVITSLIAMVLAVPVAVTVALFVTEVAPKRLQRPLSYLVDLLAAIPSVVYGFWGIFALIPVLKPIANFLTSTIGKVPGIGGFFTGPFFGVSYFTAGVVLAIMILPITTAICREVFATVPVAEKEAALGLGATRLEMLRMTVLPRSRSGIVGASILGLGRALGETIAVTMVIGNSVLGITQSLFKPGATMASVIANEFTEATEPFHLASLFVVAFWLLLLAVVVNAGGALVVRRSFKVAV